MESPVRVLHFVIREAGVCGYGVEFAKNFVRFVRKNAEYVEKIQAKDRKPERVEFAVGKKAYLKSQVCG